MQCNKTLFSRIIKLLVLKRIHLLLAGCALALFIVSCSTKKNKTLNRKYHALTAQYNAILNEEEIYYDSNPTSFERAEEKAIIAIQKHGMYINGKERNPKMAEAYLLLGKARYYEGRFIPAIDAFNFILTRYPSSKSINDANI